MNLPTRGHHRLRCQASYPLGACSPFHACNVLSQSDYEYISEQRTRTFLSVVVQEHWNSAEKVHLQALWVSFMADLEKKIPHCPNAKPLGSFQWCQHHTLSVQKRTFVVGTCRMTTSTYSPIYILHLYKKQSNFHPSSPERLLTYNRTRAVTCPVQHLNKAPRCALCSVNNLPEPVYAPQLQAV